MAKLSCKGYCVEVKSGDISEKYFFAMQPTQKEIDDCKQYFSEIINSDNLEINVSKLWCGLDIWEILHGK